MSKQLFEPPAHRSYSQVSSYIRCGKAFQLTRVLRAPERPSVYLVGGSAVHDVIEHLARRKHTQPDIEPIDADTLTDLWLDAWKSHADRVAEESGISDPAEWRAAGRKTKDKPNGEDADWWISEGHQMVARAAAWIDTQYEQGMVIYEDEHGPWVERGLTVPIGGVPTKMFLDAVFVMPGGELLVVDWKTGTRVPKHTQLSLYALGMQQAKAPRPPLGAYWMARTGELSAPSSLPESFDLVLSAMFEQADLGIRAGIFIPNTDAYCDSCAVNRFCAAYGGVEADQYDTIILDHV